MNLEQMITEVRRSLFEPTADLWSNDEIIDWLNEGARIMVHDAQPLQTLYQFASVSGQQEYLMPTDFDEAFSVAYFRGNLQHLNFRQPVDAQDAALYTGLPEDYYLRQYTLKTAPQISTNNIQLSQADPINPTIARTYVGLYPAPGQSGDICTVSYFPRHFQMVLMTDVSPIPIEFRRGVIFYAIAFAKIKEGALGEFDKYLGLFEQFKTRLRTKMINRGQLMEFPKIKIMDEPGDPGSSVIIIPNPVS